MGVTPSGLASIVKTRGNQDLHVILRGGTSGTNYDAESVKKVRAKLEKDRPAAWPSIMIDASREFFCPLLFHSFVPASFFFWPLAFFT
jgi:3-deoxy-7-phosphoheptulonate synthase